MLALFIRDFLPREIRTRGRMGFGIPLGDWFMTRWRRTLEARLLLSDAKIYQWLRPEFVQGLTKAHFARTIDYGRQLWALLT